MQNRSTYHKHNGVLGSWRPGRRKWFQQTWSGCTRGNWEQRGCHLRPYVQTVPRTARGECGVRLRLGILNIGEETDTEITGLGGCTRLRLEVGGAKHRCEGL